MEIKETVRAILYSAMFVFAVVNLFIIIKARKKEKIKGVQIALSIASILIGAVLLLTLILPK